MQKTTGAQVMARAFDFLSPIEGSAPGLDFINLELTGDQIADNFLSQVALMMLQQLKDDGMVTADDLSQPDAKIYGLTKQGVEMHTLFRRLAYT